jgi:antitoxin (DNA-binding transcriptional repressor) of toxin-antitoxin stability system
MDLRDGRRAKFRTHGAPVKLICVPPNQVRDFLPIVRRHIDAALRRAVMTTVDEVVSEVSAGQALLWLAVDVVTIVGAGVTKIIAENGRKVCVIMAWGSDDQTRCAPLLAVIEGYARDENCTAVRLYGRVGWTRRLAGYRVKSVLMERAL